VSRAHRPNSSTRRKPRTQGLYSFLRCTGTRVRTARGFHDRLEEAGLDVLTYVGGNLAVGQDDFESTRERFREMGFDRVFDAETDPEEAIASLRRDLQITTTEPETVRVDS